MKAELIDISECKKNLQIEVPQDIVDVEMTHIAQEIAKRARVPGFRPGKAPIGVVKTRYRDEIISEMMQHLLPKCFGEAVDDRKLDIVEAPRFEGIDYAAGQPLRFKAVFEVYPQLNITNYIEIPVEEISSKVEESEVEASLKKLQDEMAELAPVEEDRPIQEGDFAEISFIGTLAEEGQPPVTADKAVCEIGGRTTLKEFTEQDEKLESWVIDHLKAQLREKKEKAAEALGNIGAPEAQGALEAALAVKNEDEWVNLRGAQALARCGSPKGVDYLLRIARNAEAKVVRDQALILALRLTGRPPAKGPGGVEGKAALASLEAWWKDGESKSRWDPGAGQFMITP